MSLSGGLPCHTRLEVLFQTALLNLFPLTLLIILSFNVSWNVIGIYKGEIIINHATLLPTLQVLTSGSVAVRKVIGRFSEVHGLVLALIRKVWCRNWSLAVLYTKAAMGSKRSSDKIGWDNLAIVAPDGGCADKVTLLKKRANVCYKVCEALDHNPSPQKTMY